MRIITDTNFLISAVRFKLDIFRELRGHSLYYISQTKAELEKIAKGKGKDAKAAWIALVMLEDMKELKSSGPADPALLRMGKRGFAIATQDRELKARLKAESAKFIYIRQRRYLTSE